MFRFNIWKKCLIAEIAQCCRKMSFLNMPLVCTTSKVVLKLMGNENLLGRRQNSVDCVKLWFCYCNNWWTKAHQSYQKRKFSLTNLETTKPCGSYFLNICTYIKYKYNMNGIFTINTLKYFREGFIWSNFPVFEVTNTPSMFVKVN